MRLLISLLWLVCPFLATAQIEDPVTWKFSSEKISDHDAFVVVTAEIEPGWHVYSQFIKEGGPIPTTFRFEPSKDYSLQGAVLEMPKALPAFDKSFDMQIAWHQTKVQFRQRIKLSVKTTSIKGSLEYMVCNDQKCLPPNEVEFNVPVDLIAGQLTPKVQDSSDAALGQPIPEIAAAGKQAISAGKQHPLQQRESESYLGILIAGFLGGLAAFFMPCIYPMIPLTVSFFTKHQASRGDTFRHAVMYGLSIITIYVGLGLLITLVFGASALNEAASSASFNLAFFVVLVVFALSFLGAFEILLPSVLVNKMDQKSDKGGIIGLFFMAFTLALVSFSCTGPIIGTLLVDAVSKGSYLGPAMGMLGFSSALAVPFTLFAIFPSALKQMPKSGGWLNSVKVSLGFLELALAFKFLSNVDLAYHWGIFTRDVFLIIWIVIFTFLGLYLTGKIRFSNDQEIRSMSLPRLFFAMLVFGFTIYLIPGIWGAPLKPISAWLPPQTTQDFDLTAHTSEAATQQTTGKKYADLFDAPHKLDAFYDYQQALLQSKKINKPVLVDFTGWSCTNCRKMETSVWSDPKVLERLKQDYVLVSLYVDDKTELPDQEKYTSKFSGKRIKTVGQKWSDFQASTFGTNSQPYYIVVNAAGEKLTEPKAFDLNIQGYASFLDSGKAAFQKCNKI